MILLFADCLHKKMYIQSVTFACQKKKFKAPASCYGVGEYFIKSKRNLCFKRRKRSQHRLKFGMNVTLSPQGP